MPRHITHEKISSSHTTVIDAAEDIVEFLIKLPEVKKIVLGIVKGLKGGGSIARVKTIFDDNLLRIKIRGNSSIQEIYVISTDRAKVKKLLDERFEN